MLIRWILGMTIGTAIIAVTSPWFVRSYLPRQANRGVRTLPAGERYRWRSEGFATSSIGRFGMVGGPASDFETSDGERDFDDGLHIALWGDSQAEGVCVEDNQKIATIAGQISPRLTVWPLARSGDDASDWLSQISFAETYLSSAAHVFLIAELSDLAAATNEHQPESESRFDGASGFLPGFVIHAARNLITGSDGTTMRRLHFGLGRVAMPTLEVTATDSKARVSNAKSSTVDWHPVLQKLDDATDRPVIVLYAPAVPSIIGGRIHTEDDNDASFRKLLSEADSFGIRVVDLRPMLRSSADQGRWPHGFHNGQIGSGHLNATGNRIVAEAIVRVCDSLDR